MALGGRAWRGYFPLGGELTSGQPDWKEGLYLGTELPDEHPLVRAGTPVHGRNLFPDVPGLRDTVLAWMTAVTQLGHRLMEGVASSLALPPDYFAARCTADCRQLRLQHRRHARPHDRRAVPLHAAPRRDQPQRARSPVVPAVPRPEVFQPGATHRGAGRCAGARRQCGALDRANVHAFSGRYGDYLLDKVGKVGKVFPELRAHVL